MLQASTSEVYGDPISHPQQESDWGNVNLSVTVLVMMKEKVCRNIVYGLLSPAPGEDKNSANIQYIWSPYVAR